MRRTLALLAIIGIVIIESTSAQGPVRLIGVITFSDGGVMPGVTVTLSHVDLGTFTTTSDEVGRFQFPNLRPGHYHLHAELTGFKTTVRDVDVTVERPADLRLTMELASIGESVPVSGGAGEAARIRNHARIPVFYATDRNRVAKGPLSYGGEREPSDTLHLGRFIVSVPRDHKRGHIERPDVWSLWSEDPEKHFIIVKRERLSYEKFYGSLRDDVHKSAKKQAFVFVHGFNVTFENALYRAAQLAYDLDFDGAPILYSWPSVARTVDYRIDERNIEWTADRLRWFLEDVRERTGAQVVHVIAHSMGNRALAAALGQMAPPTGSQARFSQVVLTAPDIDVGLFPALAARLKRVAGRVTMYASDHDLALEAARKYDTFQRVGSTRPTIVLLDGIEVIDASAVDTSFLGHSYIGNSKTVLSDLIDVISGAAANTRKFIELRGEPPLTYWAFR